ncbi:hypothetical protein ACFU7Z_39505, partial [Kitasatospora sp. NPDC057518]
SAETDGRWPDGGVPGNGSAAAPPSRRREIPAPGDPGAGAVRVPTDDRSVEDLAQDVLRAAAW